MLYHRMQRFLTLRNKKKRYAHLLYRKPRKFPFKNKGWHNGSTRCVDLLSLVCFLGFPRASGSDVDTVSALFVFLLVVELKKNGMLTIKIKIVCGSQYQSFCY